MAWMYLIIAGLFETVWAVSLRSTEGWTKLWPSAFTVAAMLLSFFLVEGVASFTSRDRVRCVDRNRGSGGGYSWYSHAR